MDPPERLWKITPYGSKLYVFLACYTERVRPKNLTILFQMTLLGGINMVDYDPWSGNYTNTIVRNNIIRGGFATDPAETGESKGVNEDDAIIK